MDSFLKDPYPFLDGYMGDGVGEIVPQGGGGIWGELATDPSLHPRWIFENIRTTTGTEFVVIFHILK